MKMSGTGSYPRSSSIRQLVALAAACLITPVALAAPTVTACSGTENPRGWTGSCTQNTEWVYDSTSDTLGFTVPSCANGDYHLIDSITGAAHVVFMGQCNNGLQQHCCAVSGTMPSTIALVGAAGAANEDFRFKDTQGGTEYPLTYAVDTVVYGGGGDDEIRGSDRTGVSETFYGDGGIDTIYGFKGPDLIYGGAGNDLLYGGDFDPLVGGDGQDTIYGDGGDDYIEGGAQSDTLYGGADADDIFGGGYDDTIYGQGGDDECYGGDTTSTTETSTGNDTMLGGGGNDTLYGADGNDQINGGGGTDTIDAGTNDDIVCSLDDALDSALGQFGNDHLFSRYGWSSYGCGGGTADYSNVTGSGDGCDYSLPTLDGEALCAAF